MNSLITVVIYTFLLPSIYFFGRRAIADPMTSNDAGTVMLPTIVIGRLMICGMSLMPSATMRMLRYAATSPGQNSVLGVNLSLCSLPVISDLPMVKTKKVLATLSIAA